MKRLLGLLLALAVLLPMCHAIGQAPVGAPAMQAQGSATMSAPAGQTRCPVDLPTKQDCAPTADPQPNIAQLAPRPDASGAFGAAPAGRHGQLRATGPQLARAPDLHALSISRT